MLAQFIKGVREGNLNIIPNLNETDHDPIFAPVILIANIKISAIQDELIEMLILRAPSNTLKLDVVEADTEGRRWVVSLRLSWRWTGG